MSLHHCLECREVFKQAHTLRSHKKKEMCQKKCQTAHNHSFLSSVFDTVIQCKEWIQSQELDEQFLQVSGNAGTYFRYACNRDKRYQKNNYEYKSRHGSRKNLNCSAGFSIYQFRKCNCGNDASSKCTSMKLSFIVAGCIAHNHDPDVKFDRISALRKKETIEKLRQDVPVTKVVTDSFKRLVQDKVSDKISTIDPDQKPMTKKPMTYLDVWRLKNCLEYKENNLDPKDEVGNAMKLLEDLEFVAYNFDSILNESIDSEEDSHSKSIHPHILQSRNANSIHETSLHSGIGWHTCHKWFEENSAHSYNLW